ncbi:ATP-dependent Clp protease, protease subunit [Liquorilactobacillus capillatus DSM 19910]|uniref:ATP-dependent Clp protease, protease subunit n=2 Tax=Liquorilactobacillus capillatus TaxID=480931 RepID=A0A0R1MBB1_9LACO|nr:ATP-dependent Clp protease, protease subunit [Liquorilactobacillus capillatus DSM 19910]
MIKGDVVDDKTAAFYQFFGMPAVSPSGVADALNSDDPSSDVEVDIASNGGDVFAASEIYTMLKGVQGNVTVNIQGLAASAASVIAMAGDKVNISPTAQIMIHKAWSQQAGNSDDLNHEANVLNGIDQSIASAYEAKTGMKQSDLLQLMSNETWLTAKDAVDKGFADEIMFANENQLQPVNAISHIPSKKAINKFMNLFIKHNNMESDADDDGDNNLNQAINPLYAEGSTVKVLADHMPGMEGAVGTVKHAYNGNTYMIDYQPTDGSPEVLDHKWVTEDELTEPDPIENETNSQHANSLKKSKLAILFGKK